MTADLASQKIPATLRPRAAELIALTDRFCAEHLDSEYADLSRRLIARLARKRPSPLERGEARSWAGGVVHALGSINFLFDRSFELHIGADQIAAGFRASKATTANKARRIRDMLRLGPFDPEFSRKDVLTNPPLEWFFEVNGLIIDARTLSLISVTR